MAVVGKRFRRYHARKGLHPAAIVAICLVGAVLLTVLTGNLLGMLVDEETYDSLTKGDRETEPLPMGDGAKKRAVNAYPFTLGDPAELAGGVPAVTVLLNDPANGSMAYTSDTAAYLGLAGNEAVQLHESLAELSVYTPFIGGVFYSQAFKQSLPDLMYAKGAEEAALLREFSRAGGSEIVLCGLPLDDASINAVCSYISLVSHAVGTTPVGIAIDGGDPQLAEKWECLAKIAEAADFMVLDLRGFTLDSEDVDDTGVSPKAEALMQELAYYFKTYSMRPMLSEAQTGLLSTLEAKIYPDYQVVAN